MPTFIYNAKDSSGKSVSGTIDSESRETAAKQLDDRGLFPITIKEYAPLTIETLLSRDKQQKLNKFGGELDRAGLPLLILGCIHLFVERLDLAWGLVLIAVGIANIFVTKPLGKRRELFIVNGIAIIVAGIINIVAAEHYDVHVLGLFGLLQWAWGFHEMRKFWKHWKATKSLKESAESINPVPRKPVQHINIKTFTRPRFGFDQTYYLKLTNDCLHISCPKKHYEADILRQECPLKLTIKEQKITLDLVDGPLELWFKRPRDQHWLKEYISGNGG